MFAEHFAVSIKKKESLYAFGSSKIDNQDIVIIFPNTFMNNSGLAVSSALKYYDGSPDNLIVVHDEIELPFGEVRTKFGGGHKGHNGIRSIIRHIASPDFSRVRIGVGRPDHPETAVADFLLSDFIKEELEKIKELSPLINQIILSLISDSSVNNS